MYKQNIKKTYIGYDLGDGETITDLVTLIAEEAGNRTDFKDMQMPGIKDSGRAIPTVFAFDANGKMMFSEAILAMPEEVKNVVVNFKRRPTDLLKREEGKSDAELMEFLRKKSKWPSASEWKAGNTDEMLNFKNSVIAFTNAIFDNSDYMERVRSAASSSEEIVFCVGHPTNWSDLDIAIYKLIMHNSVLGAGKYADKKTSIVMEAESRAAFLYSKDLAAFGNLSKGSSVLLIDLGSSTIDLTAMTASSNNYQYNSGSNYLGARSIDFIIRDWYLEQLKANPSDWSLYQSIMHNNFSVANALTLACRKAKEDVYTSGIGVVRFGLFRGVRISSDELDQLIERTPIANVLKETIKLPAEECHAMGSKSWKQLFHEFLMEKKKEMNRLDIEVTHIILTGSASKMTFVPQIILEVFSEVSSNSLKYDMDPSRTISKGLALVGPSDDKSKIFTQDINHLIDEKLPQIIKSNVPALGSEMGKIISGVVTPIIRKRIGDWKNGSITTIDDMNRKIKEDCSEKNLMKVLENNKDYKTAIEKWLKDKVGKDIAVELKAICDKHGVHGLSVENLNIMTIPDVNISGVAIDPLAFMNVISAIMAVVAGVIAAASITTIMAVIIVILSLISETLAVTLFWALVGMGPVGWTILAAVVGIAVAVLFSEGTEYVKELFKDKVMEWNLPEVARRLVRDDRIDESIRKADISGQIEESFKKAEVGNDIAYKLAVELKLQVEKRAEDIKYAIQNK